MTRARVRHVIVVLAAVLAIFSLVVVSRSIGRKRQPVALEVVGLKYDANGHALAVVQLRNRTHVGLNYVFWTQVLSNGIWVDALTQHPEAKTANWLLPHRQRTVEIPVSQEGSAWRIELHGGWVLGRVETLLCRACQKLKLPYRFAEELHEHSEAHELVAAPNPQAGANGSQALNLETNGASAAAASRRSP